MAGTRIRTLLKAAPDIVRGTSNVYLAKKLGITPIGTMAHEFLQAFQALDVRLRNFQKAALESWVHEYRGDLGIALTDVVGMDAFLRDFDLYSPNFSTACATIAAILMFGATKA